MTLKRIESARADWLAEGWMSSRLVSDELSIGSNSHGDTLIEWVSGDRPASATVRDVATAGDRVSRSLKVLGLRRGDVIACQLPNWHEAAVLTYAALTSGLVLLPIVPTYGSAELAHVLAESRARAIVLPRRWRKTEYLARLRDVLPLPSLEFVIVVDDDRGDEFIDWTSLTGASDRPPPTPAGDEQPNDACVIIYTSGSSARPKGVIHTHESVLASTRISHEFFPFRAPRFAPNPSGHMGALMALLDAMIFGKPVVFMDAWDPDEAVRTCARIEPAFMPASTPFLQMLLESEGRLGVVARSPQYVGVGGTTVPAELLERIESSGRRGFRMYGSSEVPVATSCRYSDPFDVRAHTDGYPVLNGGVVIVGQGGEPLATGLEGEVLLQSPQMFRGYVDGNLDRDSLTSEGWFRTGDLGTLGADGSLTITGRVKDIVIRGGENISAQEIESIVLAHPAVREAAIIGLPDERLGERACCNVRLAAGYHELELEDLRDLFVRRGVATFKQPERLVIWDRDFPRSAEGKVKKPAMRAIVLEAGPSAGRVA